jgi:anti-anti-sigma factor
MDIVTSLGEGVPVLTLTGRFDGAAAVVFDERTGALETDTAHWVIDFTGVTYLSSLGIRSLVSLETRLKARDGGLILAGLAPLVRRVLEVSRLDSFWRIVAAPAEGIAKARAAGSRSPVIEITSSRCRARIRRLTGAESTLERWGAGSSRGSDEQLRGLSPADLGVAFGAGTLGGMPGTGCMPGAFVSTPQFTAVLGVDSDGITDFVVGDASQIVPINVASAWGLSGVPAAVLELHGTGSFSLFDALDDMIERAVDGPPPPVLGVAVLAQTPGQHPGLFATGITFDPRATVERAPHLHAEPDQVALPSGRRLIGGAVTLRKKPSVDAAPELHDALRGQATLESLGGIVTLSECASVTDALVWVFSPREIRSGAAKLLQVRVEGDGNWRPEWDAIIRRLYADSQSVTLTPLHGGYMSSTFRAVAYDHDGRRTLPSVVKIGATEVTRREVEANRNYVSRFILNNGTTVLGDAQHGEWAGLRYNFLGINGPDSRLMWLYDHYRQRPVDAVMTLLDQVFTRVLKPWYAQPKWEQVFLFRDHTPLRLFPALFETAEQVLGISADSPHFDCPELGTRLPNPFHFLKHEYPRRSGESRLWYTAVCHGDLNLKNILVDERDNLYVIDFSETRPRNAVSDFARMEPVLKFEMIDPESDEELRRVVQFEEALMSVTALDQPPPFRYAGTDPMVTRAHAGISLLRRCADRATLFETDMVPYWIALLEWTYPVVCYRQLSLRLKRYAACSAALICRSIRQIEGRA